MMISLYIIAVCWTLKGEPTRLVLFCLSMFTWHRFSHSSPYRRLLSTIARFFSAAILHHYNAQATSTAATNSSRQQQQQGPQAENQENQENQNKHQKLQEQHEEQRPEVLTKLTTVSSDATPTITTTTTTPTITTHPTSSTTAAQNDTKGDHVFSPSSSSSSSSSSTTQLLSQQVIHFLIQTCSIALTSLPFLSISSPLPYLILLHSIIVQFTIGPDLCHSLFRYLLYTRSSSSLPSSLLKNNVNKDKIDNNNNNWIVTSFIRRHINTIRIIHNNDDNVTVLCSLFILSLNTMITLLFMTLCSTMMLVVVESHYSHPVLVLSLIMLFIVKIGIVSIVSHQRLVQKRQERTFSTKLEQLYHIFYSDSPSSLIQVSKGGQILSVSHSVLHLIDNANNTNNTNNNSDNSGSSRSRSDNKAMMMKNGQSTTLGKCDHDSSQEGITCLSSASSSQSSQSPSSLSSSSRLIGSDIEDLFIFNTEQERCQFRALLSPKSALRSKSHVSTSQNTTTTMATTDEMDLRMKSNDGTIYHMLAKVIFPCKVASRLINSNRSSSSNDRIGDDDDDDDDNNNSSDETSDDDDDHHCDCSYSLLILKNLSERENLQKVLEKAKERAEGASKAKSAFLNHMSHEIRTPLCSIFAHVELLLCQGGLNKEQLDTVTSIQSSSMLLRNLISDVLDVAKIEAGKLVLDHSKFKLSSCVETVHRIMKSIADAKQLELNMRTSERIQHLSFLGDNMRLNQVLINLVGNAVKFTQQGSVNVLITDDLEELRHESHLYERIREFDQSHVRDPTKQERRLIFVVKDTGIGIRPERMKDLFQQFTQVHHDHDDETSTIPGTGLGLSISRSLIEMMRGQVFVHSELKRGSTFFFTAILDELVRKTPATAAATTTTAAAVASANGVATTRSLPSSASSSSSSSSSPSASLTTSTSTSTGNNGHAGVDDDEEKAIDLPDMSQLRVLIVEDNPVNQKILNRILKFYRVGHVVLANNGKSGVEEYRKSLETGQVFHLIFMDIFMPVMGGYEATRIIRTMDKNITIIGLSANASSAARLESVESGMTKYCSKPYSMSQIAELLRQEAKRKLINEQQQQQLSCSF